jgi:hypothetical protein
MGPATCAAWPKSGRISSAAKAVPLNWALGFLSGWAAQANPKLLDMVEPEGVSAWLDTYCQAHPNDTLPTAVLAFEGELEAKLPPPPPPQPVMQPFTLSPPKPPPPKPAPVKKRAAPAKAKPKSQPKAAARPAAPAPLRR